MVSHDPSNVACGACIITLYRMNYVRLHIVQNECEQVFSAIHTADAKSLRDSCSVVRMRSERSLFVLALPDSKLLKFGRSISALYFAVAKQLRSRRDQVLPDRPESRQAARELA